MKTKYIIIFLLITNFVLGQSERTLSSDEKQFYKIREGELAIKQEYTNPNKGEFVFLNGKVAPNDKYRLGFMNYIIVENGKIKQFSML